MPVRLELKSPHRAQRKVLREAKRFNVVACGRRWGKTETGLHHLAPQPLLEGKPVGWFAPSYKLLDEAWNGMVALLRPFGASVKISKQERKIILPTGGVMDFWTLSTSTEGRSEAGRGRKYARAFIDEAAHAKWLKDDWNQAIRPTLADLRGDAWFLSTPRGRDYFWRLWKRGQDGTGEYASWRMPTATNPYIAASEIEAARAELPRDAFAQEFEAEFLADAANPFGITAIHACVQETPMVARPVCWGIDLAKSQDWTVATGLDEAGNVVAWQRWQADWRNTTHRLVGMIGDRPALVDSTGVGDPIVEQLQARCPSVEGYKFTQASKQMLMEGLAVAIQRGETSFPDGVIVHELESFQYEYTRTGVRYVCPEGEHDDCVDSLALAVRYLRTRPRAASFASGYDSGDDGQDARWFDRVEDPAIWQDW